MNDRVRDLRRVLWRVGSEALGGVGWRWVVRGFGRGGRGGWVGGDRGCRIWTERLYDGCRGRCVQALKAGCRDWICRYNIH